MQLSLRREHCAPRLPVDFRLFFRRGSESDAEDGILIAHLGQRIALLEFLYALERDFFIPKFPYRVRDALKC